MTNLLITKKRQYFFIFVVYLSITLLIFWHRLPYFLTQYGMPDVDTDGTMWYFWARIFAEQHSFYFNYNNIFFGYPYGYDFSNIPFFSLIYEASIFLIKFFGGTWKAIIGVSNFSALIAYPLSALSAFSLAHYVTRNKYASFVAGLIFSFSSYHILMGRGSITNNHIEFIPLYFLSLFYALDRKTIAAFISSALIFSLAFMTNAYWAFFCGLFSPFFVLWYQRLTLKDGLLLTLKYYSILFGVLILTNINYLISQSFLFQKSNIAAIAGKTITPENQVVNILSFFSPSANSWLSLGYPGGENFLGFVALAFGLAGLFLLRRNRKFIIFLGCFLLSIILASNIPGLFFINKIYFFFFGMFRSVSRFSVFSSLFLAIMTALVLSYLIPKIMSYRQKIILLLFILVLSVSVVFDGLTRNQTFWRLTDFSKIAELYEPIRENSNIKVIAPYPMLLSNGTNGFPPGYQLFGQIIHNKTLVNGVDPTLPASFEYYSKVRDISNFVTVDFLAMYGVDTILIYKNLLPNSMTIINRLKKDSRLSYIGDYQVPADQASYISTNDLSRNITVFQIKKVITDDLRLTIDHFSRDHLNFGKMISIISVLVCLSYIILASIVYRRRRRLPIVHN